jgi:hypothetical protein
LCRVLHNVERPGCRRRPRGSGQNTDNRQTLPLCHVTGEELRLPKLTPDEVRRLRQKDVRYLGLLCKSLGQLQMGLEAMNRHGIPFRERAELRSRGLRIWWVLLHLTETQAPVSVTCCERLARSSIMPQMRSVARAVISHQKFIETHESGKTNPRGTVRILFRVFQRLMIAVVWIPTAIRATHRIWTRHAPCRAF